MRQRLTTLNINLQGWEERATGLLPPSVRRNMRIDLTAAMFFGPFVAGLSFLPVVMRRLGAPPEWLAFYAAQAFIGFLLTSFSVLVAALARVLPADRLHHQRPKPDPADALLLGL
jgi:hypothetical protein